MRSVILALYFSLSRAFLFNNLSTVSVTIYWSAKNQFVKIELEQEKEDAYLFAFLHMKI